MLINSDSGGPMFSFQLDLGTQHFVHRLKSYAEISEVRRQCLYHAFKAHIKFVCPVYYPPCEVADSVFCGVLISLMIFSTFLSGNGAAKLTGLSFVIFHNAHLHYFP